MGDERFEHGLGIFKKLTAEGTPSPADNLADLAPHLGRLVIYGLNDILNRPALDLRTREIATLCMLATLGGCEAQLEFHIAAALRVGVAPQEIVEAFTQVSGYVGFPRALNAIAVAGKVFEAQQVRHPTAPGPRAVVVDFLDAYQGGDIDRATRLLADDVEWQVPGDRTVMPWAGTWTGHDGFHRFVDIAKNAAETDYLRYGEPLPHGDRVVVPGSFSFRFPPPGRSYAGDFVVDFQVRDGLIARYQIHEDTWALAKAYTGG